MSRPLVVLDADVLGRRRTGDETYVASLLAELPALAPDLRFAAVTRHPELVPEGVAPLPLPARSQLLRMGLRLPRLLRARGARLAHVLYVLPPGAPAASVVTVADLSFELQPGLMPVHDRLLFRTLVPRSVRRAARVIAVSERTKADLVDRYAIDPARIAVTPLGVDSAFTVDGPVPDRGRYLLAVGGLEPRKDPVSALEALARLDDGLRLVFVGPRRHAADDARTTARRLGLEERVEFLGHVKKSELASLYRGAACLVFPSRYEGFGLPVVEAMASGTPVVATRVGAIPEVAGEAAVLVAPGDPVALAQGVERALAERDRLVAVGLERARLFSWQETARRTLDVYRELL